MNKYGNGTTMDNKKLRFVRTAVQVLFFGFVLFITLSHGLRGMGIELPWEGGANFHAVCPFGAVESLGRLLFQGRFIPKTGGSNLWVLGGVLASTLLFGSFFCGWLCPLGSIQEWIGKIGKKLWPKLYNRVSGTKADRILGYLRYGVLIFVLVQTTRMVSLVFRSIDPYYALFHFWTGDVALTAFGVLAMVLVGSLFVHRPWCRWLCPFGAVLGLVQKLSPWKIRKGEDSCTACGLCSRACPMGIDVAKKEAVTDARCNRCGECLSKCRRSGALGFSLSGERSGIRRFARVGVLALAIFLGTVLVGGLAGGFEQGTVGTRQGKGGIEQAISGSMTVEELASGLGLDAGAARDALGLPEDLSMDIKLYDLEEIDETLTLHEIKSRVSVITDRD